MPGAYSLYRIGQWLSGTLSSDHAYWLAERLAEAHCRQSPADCRAVAANLTAITGQSVEPHAPMVSEVFRNFGRYLVEFFNIHRARLSMTLDDPHHTRHLLQRPGGCILVSAHLGNWEVCGTLIHRLGFPISAVALPHRDPRVNRFFDAQRRRCGVNVISLGQGATQRCLDALHAGRLLGMIGDREFGENGLTIPFLGQQAMIPRGPALLSIRTGAPIVPVFLVREGPWQFRLFLDAPLWPPRQERTHDAIRLLTHLHAQVLEGYLRRFPTQWLIFKSFAKRPEERLGQTVATQRGGPSLSLRPAAPQLHHSAK